MPEGRATVALVVAGAPGGERAARVEIEAGCVVSVTPGPVPEGEADLVLTVPVGDAEAVGRGEQGIDVAFMRGSAKLVGSSGTFMDLLGVFDADEWRAACRDLAAAPAP